jgi:hypothetical protein
MFTALTLPDHVDIVIRNDRWRLDSACHVPSTCRTAAMLLLRTGISCLSTLCLKRCRCIELLFDARLSFQALLSLFRRRGTAGGGRHRSLTEAAGGERKARRERKDYPLHPVAPLTRHTHHFYKQSCVWEGRSAQFGDIGDS